MRDIETILKESTTVAVVGLAPDEKTYSNIVASYLKE